MLKQCITFVHFPLWINFGNALSPKTANLMNDALRISFWQESKENVPFVPQNFPLQIRDCPVTPSSAYHRHPETHSFEKFLKPTPKSGTLRGSV